MEVVNENSLGDLKLKAHSATQPTSNDVVKCNGEVNGEEEEERMETEEGDESPCNGDTGSVAEAEERQDSVEDMEVSHNGVADPPQTDNTDSPEQHNHVSPQPDTTEQGAEDEAEAEDKIEEDESSEKADTESCTDKAVESPKEKEPAVEENDDSSNKDDEPDIVNNSLRPVTIQRVTPDSNGQSSQSTPQRQREKEEEDEGEEDGDGEGGDGTEGFETVDLLTPVKDSEGGSGDSRTDSTPEKGQSSKKKKPVTVSNVTPRRSSRNLNKTRSYVDEAEVKSEEEEEDLHPAPLSAPPPLSKIEPKPQVVIQPATIIKKNTIVVNDTKRLAEIAAGSKAAAAKGGKKEPTLVIIDTNSLLANKSGSVSLTPTLSSRVSVVPVSSPQNHLAKAVKVPAAVSITPPPSTLITKQVLATPIRRDHQLSSSVTVTSQHISSREQKHVNSAQAVIRKINQEVILPSLTDDMFVVEAPSFIVPYVYEKPPVNALKDYLKDLGRRVKEEEEERKKREEEEQREEDKQRLEEQRKRKEIKGEAVEEDQQSADVKVKEEEEKMDVDKDAVKEEIKDKESEDDKEKKVEIKKEEKEDDEKMDVEVKDIKKEDGDGEKTKEDGEKDSEKGDGDKVKVKEEVDEVEGKKESSEAAVAKDEKKEVSEGAAATEEKKEAPAKDEKKEGSAASAVSEEKKESSAAPTASEEKKKSSGADPEVLEDKTNKTKSDNYFDNPLGKFFMQIGINLVQEHVQTDLLKNQMRRKDKEGTRVSADVHMAISALTKTLQVSKENNKPFHFELNKCQLCNFKTESRLVMAHHLETPHMKNFVYRCNYCELEVRSPHDILFHMEAEHNVRGRLDRSPAFHQCPNCPFEDNQKGKLSRHLLSCAKKYKPERNQEPPLEWEPPAKIPRVKGVRQLPLYPTPAQAAGVLTGATRLSSLQGVTSPLSRLSPNQAALAAQRGRGRPPIYVQRYPPTNNPPAAHKLAHIRQSVVFRPSNQPPVLLPAAPYSLQPGLIQQGKGVSNGGATAKILQQPSISITPLPRSSAGSTAGSTSNPTTNPAQLKPGRPPTAPPPTPAKNSFVICEICDGYIKDLEQLRNHMQWIHKVKIHPKMIYNRPPLNCQKCQFRFFTDQGLERHLLGSHGLVTSSMQEAANKGKDGGRCPVCGRVYQWKLLNHVARDHSMSLKPAHLSYKCTVCTATFGMYKQFENHVYSAHSVVAKRVIDKTKPAQTSQSTPSSQQPASASPSTQQPSTSSTGESMLKPLKINDEITIIPQPARAKGATITKTSGGATVTPTSVSAKSSK